jgi:hypothetical protein
MQRQSHLRGQAGQFAGVIDHMVFSSGHLREVFKDFRPCRGTHAGRAVMDSERVNLNLGLF